MWMNPTHWRKVHPRMILFLEDSSKNGHMDWIVTIVIFSSINIMMLYVCRREPWERFIGILGE
jgi:hypothetical protein